MLEYGVESDGSPRFRAVGQGNLPIPAIVQAAREAGTQWLIIEQDDHWISGDPFVSLETSLRFLKPLV